MLGNNMFAYCANNPIMFADDSGYIFFPCAFQSGERSGRPPYIDNQDEEPYSSMPMGESTIGKMGCGIVATYNALLSLGNYTSFSDVYDYYTSKPYRLVSNGKGGISAITVASYFLNQGYMVLVTCDPERIDQCSANAGASIMLYNYTSGSFANGNLKVSGHFVEYSSYNGGYMGRNTSENGGNAVFMSPSEYGYKGARFFIIGIFIYKWDNE